MPHLGDMPTSSKKKDKVRGFNVRILDDNTYVVRIDNENYEKSKEYSYDSFKKMMSELNKDFGDKKEKTEEKDYLKGK